MALCGCGLDGDTLRLWGLGGTLRLGGTASMALATARRRAWCPGVAAVGCSRAVLASPSGGGGRRLTPSGGARRGARRGGRQAGAFPAAF